MSMGNALKSALSIRWNLTINTMIEYFKDITVPTPGWFWLLGLVPRLVVWYVLKRHHQTASLTISSLRGFKMGQGLLPRLKPGLFVLKMLGLILLITAMARPQTIDVSKRV